VSPSVAVVGWSSGTLAASVKAPAARMRTMDLEHLRWPGVGGKTWSCSQSRTTLAKMHVIFGYSNGGHCLLGVWRVQRNCWTKSSRRVGLAGLGSGGIEFDDIDEVFGLFIELSVPFS
jgi:hypothetical protein